MDLGPTRHAPKCAKKIGYLAGSVLDLIWQSPQCGETGRGYRRNALVSWMGDDIEQRLDTLASDRRDDPELGKMSPDYIRSPLSAGE